MLNQQVTTHRVSTLAERQDALLVLADTYREEKRWVEEEESLFPTVDLGSDGVTWFLVRLGDRPAGVVRVCYDPPLDQYANYGLTFLQEGIDVEAFLQQHRIAEIGRFAVRRRYRRKFAIAAALMRAATQETVQRDYTHYITDVFQGEVNSPYEFHTRVVGFQPVATHDTGELHCPNRRITLVLNLREAYHRLRQSRRQVHEFLTRGWDEATHQKLRI
ncbi:MAG: GNAT family N-acetyltransferase [Acidobacteria bacterium]|nr:GNAT family N-acetyltransferase [Acidobacteriota bacterium]